MNMHRAEASRLADDQVRLLESIGDPSLTVGLLPMSCSSNTRQPKWPQILRLSERLIDLADGDHAKGDVLFGSPLAYGVTMRGIARASLGIAGWKQDFTSAAISAHDVDAMTHASVVYYTYLSGIALGLLRPDATVLAQIAEAYEAATEAAEDVALGLTEAIRGAVISCQEGTDRAAVVELLLQARERVLDQGLTPPIIDSYIAREKMRLGEIDAAVELSRATVDVLATAERCIWIVLATTVLVETLLTRGSDTDLDEADVAIDRLAAAPTDPGYVVNDIAVLRLRALLAQARGEADLYRGYRDQYRAMATSLGFEGHMATAAAMA